MKKLPGIYQIKNIIDDQVYIGSSADTSDRLTKHKGMLKRNEHHCKHLQNAWNKYGERFFTFSVIVELKNEAALIEIEQHLMDKYKADGLLYNSSPTAGRTTGYRHTKEHLEMFRSLPRSERQREAARESMRNNTRNGRITLNEQSRDKIGNANAIRWRVKLPGQEEQIIFNLRKFCREKGLKYTTVIKNYAIKLQP